ncbi:hypothetical protein HPB49_009872 [Dermacentor silvarum]|uniref:Uncharacterized protein n=1 Tax=Dermacentor silvarum TaxID=543639 RepID=A0ACB8DYG4_DERSI|nr:hypothetical protein HPB49_009872 [Dermacentor silvarum]
MVHDEPKYHDDASSEQQVEQSEFRPWDQLCGLDAFPPGVDFAAYICSDASADLGATENLDDEDREKVAADAEQVPENDGMDADRVSTASEVIDAVDLLRSFVEPQEGGERALTAPASYDRVLRDAFNEKSYAV